VSVLRRKLRRDLWSMRGPLAAIVAVMSCGVATFVMSLSMIHSLRSTLEDFYADGRFGQVFAQLERAPLTLVDRIAAVPGVATVEGRISEGVILRVPDFEEPVTARVVSLSDDPDGGLNRVHLRTGRVPERSPRGRARGGRVADADDIAAPAEPPVTDAGRALEVLVNDAFAVAHGLTPGDTMEAILDGRLQTVRIVGTALSPEFIYLIAPGSILPDDRRFGVLWMHRAEMAAAFDMEGAVNDLVLRLAPGARPADVIDAVDAATERYGGTGAYTRDDQASHRFIANELEELQGTATIVPAIFLVVSAALLNIVLARLIAVQREQIAVLRALGRTRTEIGRHYLAFALAAGGISAVVGIALGAWLGRGMTGMYAEFFRFPEFHYRLPVRIAALATAIALLAAAVAVLHAVRQAMRLAPAEAMRPRPPASFRPTALARLGVHRLLPPAGRMVLRQIERHPVRAFASAIGIALATAIMVVGGSLQDGIEASIERQFTLVQRYDVDVVLQDRTDDRFRSSLAALPGVTRIEPYRAIPVRVRAGAASRRTSILGLEEADGLHRLMDVDGHDVTLPVEGLVLSDALARILGVVPGELVDIEVLAGDRERFRAAVGGTVRDMAGLLIYVRKDALDRLVRETGSAGGAYLSVDADAQPRVLEELREMPRVAAVNLTSATRRSFRETIGGNLGIMQAVLMTFSVVIGFGVIYNAARISLAERSRDLATLRVIGFSRAEISAIQLGELAALTAAAIPLGLLGGTGLAYAASMATDSELFRMPFVVHRSTYGTAVLVTVLAAMVSGLIVRRRLAELDLIAVLKSRE
jgi:putative ABC transport system permease protein